MTITLLGDRELTLAASKGSGLDKYDVAIFTASCDTVEVNTKYAKALKLDYPILSDPTKETAKAYGVVHEGRAVPERWTFYIKDGKILAIDKKVNAGAHGAEVAKKLDELGISKN